MPLVLAHPPRASGVSFLTPEQAARQEIRPLRIRVLDGTGDGELLAAWLALLSNTPLQIEILLGLRNDPAGTVPPDDALVSWAEVAPAQEATTPALLIGPTARHALERDYGLPVEHLTQSLADLVQHRVVASDHPLTAAQEPVVEVPLARTWRFGIDAVSRVPGLEVLAHSPKGGVHLIADASRHRLFVLTQLGWSPIAFARQVRRQQPGQQHDDDLPAWTWRAHAQLLVAAWLNHWVYQIASLPSKP